MSGCNVCIISQNSYTAEYICSQLLGMNIRSENGEHVKRVLAKCSGEFLWWEWTVYDEAKITEFVWLYGKLHASVEQVAIVCGGWNIRRWRDTRSMNIPRVRSDALWITATVMNAVVLANALTHAWYKAVAMSPGAYHLPSLCDRYDVNIAKAKWYVPTVFPVELLLISCLMFSVVSVVSVVGVFSVVWITISVVWLIIYIFKVVIKYEESKMF